MTEKVIRNNKVAVLYSPGFGAGWYTWNSDCKEILFDPEVVEWVLNGKDDSLTEDYIESKYGSSSTLGFYAGGMRDLEVAWIPVGKKFIIQEYDGSESIKTEEDIEWLTT